MKKALSLLILLIMVIAVVPAAVVPRVSLSEEVAFLKYNRIWTSPIDHYYSVESLASNMAIGNDIDVMFHKNIGITLGSSIGYQWSLKDKNRFATFPKNINGTLKAGITSYLDSFRISLFGALRSSFQTARNTWISQMGGGVDVSYVLSDGLFFSFDFKYLYSYEMITSGASVALGYQFGGNR